MKVTITPRFDAIKIVDETIKKDWLQFQNKSWILGQGLLNILKTYINSHRKRSGGTGNLANVMTFEGDDLGASIWWGIGNMDILNSQAPYWYVNNFGKKVTGEQFLPNNGKMLPGSFEGNAPDSSMIGKGTQKFNYKDGSKFVMTPKTFRPMHYIEYTWDKFKVGVSTILKNLK